MPSQPVLPPPPPPLAAAPLPPRLSVVSKSFLIVKARRFPRTLARPSPRYVRASPGRGSGNVETSLSKDSAPGEDTPIQILSTLITSSGDRSYR
ncbi:unnamed protein product [Danaus chrysippus]|uniref:(African queen) hypothetical protein n=1 Tax=Danaus chrysippus TaxID=151541 RepID=A0A8J2R0Y1_9NEOP|nr:unnamed protein product [Danaus chrysippus]